MGVAAILEQADLRDLSHSFYPPKEVFRRLLTLERYRAKFAAFGLVLREFYKLR